MLLSALWTGLDTCGYKYVITDTMFHCVFGG